jgi:DNA uptake protein ComE-like DNA-binding protein
MGAMIGGARGGCKAATPEGPEREAATRADAALLAVAMVVGLVLCGWEARPRRGAPAGAGPDPDPAAAAHRVDLGTAGVDELQLLPGVGPRLAERIAAERAAGGAFEDLDEVDRRVPGVGPARVRWWRGKVEEPRREGR